MRKVYLFILIIMLACIGCEWHWKPSGDADTNVAIERYDRIQSLYLTTGDFSALQQMNIVYPMQTRTLIEDVLKIGRVNDPEINDKFLNFYQDTVLQALINEVELQYANMDDLNKELTSAFKRLKKELPEVEIPMVYAQIGALDQSIIVGNNTIGVCLDKYLGAKYPLYLKYYPWSQRRLMVRSMIVPDCLIFYIMSLYPIPDGSTNRQWDCDMHVGKIQWVVNHLLKKHVFRNKYESIVYRYMKRHKEMDVKTLLVNNDNRRLLK